MLSDIYGWHAVFYPTLAAGFPPSNSVSVNTQAALSSLKDTVKKQRENLMEEMSRKGLLQSGIWAQADIDLSKGELNSQQQLLGTRLSALQEQLNTALSNLTQSKISASSQFGTAAVQEAESAAQRKQKALENITNAFMKTQELSQKSKSESARLAQEKELAQYPYMYPTVNAQLQQESAQYPYLYPTANAQLEQERFQTEWPYKAAEYDYNLNKPYYNPKTGSGGATATKNQSFAKNLNNEIAHLQDLNESYGSQTYADNYSTEEGVLAPIQAAEKDINNDRSAYLAEGVDPDRLIDELYKKIYGTSRSEYWRNANAALKGSSGSSYGLTAQ